MKLWYDRPSLTWTDALPAGNGRLGAMALGDPFRECIYLNEDTLWSGYPRKLENIDTAAAFQEIRRLTNEGKYLEADRLIEKEISFTWGQAYQPLGRLQLEFDAGELSEYRRQLCLDDAIVSQDQCVNGVHFHRELFVSAPDQVVAIKLCCDQPGKLSFGMMLDVPLRHEVSGEGNALWMKVQAPSHSNPSYTADMPNPVVYDEDRPGMRAWVLAELRHEGGMLINDGGRLLLKDADSALILIAAHTSFCGYDRMPDLPDAQIRERCRQDLAKIGDYDDLKARHVQDHQKYMGRVDFVIEGDSRDDLPTDERLRRFDPEHPDVGLYPMLFQYGRYLMIAASRPGTQAMNLQGIWNKETRPPWSSNYTININTEMNYWPALCCNLAEMQLPLIDLVRELTESGREIAKNVYGKRGSASHHNTDLWRFAWPVGNHGRDSASYGFWNMSGPWLCQHLFERYEFTRDEDYLRDVAWPIMQAHAEFVLDMLEEDEGGTLILGPSTSPENRFAVGGESAATDRTTEMTMSLARELLGNCVKACEILGIDSEEMKAALGKLRPAQISESGRIQEWYDDQGETEVHHRHISHLYGAYPGVQWNVDDTPELMAAVKRSLEVRGDEGTGWSLAWKVCQWARQHDGDHALQVLNMQLRLVETAKTNMRRGGGSYANLFCAHPPFQIDGNFGVAAGICEMLLQSRGDRIMILPALPEKWKSGHVRGLCAHGGVQAEIVWREDGGKAILSCDRACEARVSIRSGEYRKVQLLPGEKAEIVW